MVDVARARRMAVRVREIAAATIELQVKDPRLGMVTLTDAKVTPDLREATIFYTVYGDAEDRAASAVALESARGVVRAAIGRQMPVRHTPSIAFVNDDVPEVAAHVQELLDVARARDAELAKAREGAQPAGDADPYKKPRVIEEDDEDEDLDEDDHEAGE